MIVLVGFMGSGKTTVGRLLADRLGLAFCDLDDRIEASAGRRIADIFAADGEPAFRDLEHAALAALLAEAPAGVLALGGGAYAQPRNRDLLRSGGHHVLWLDVPLDRALARVGRFDHRPLARDPERFAALHASRRPAYAEADHRIPIESDEPDDAVQLILDRLGLR